jgi:nucleoside-diphosphate-sugar epimerase
VFREYVLVTGAAGFIGSHLARRLRADGHRSSASTPIAA